MRIRRNSDIIMKWKKIYNYYVGSSAIMLVLLLVMSLLVIYPAWLKIVTIKNEISAEKINLEKKLEMGMNANKIKNELKTVEESISVLDTIFIAQGNELTLLSSIEALAAQNNVTVTLKPDFKGVAMAGNITRTPLIISATGSFKNIMSFLNSLDGTVFYFNADTISLSKADKDKLDLNISGQVYIKIPDKKV